MAIDDFEAFTDGTRVVNHERIAQMVIWPFVSELSHIEAWDKTAGLDDLFTLSNTSAEDGTIRKIRVEGAVESVYGTGAVAMPERTARLVCKRVLSDWEKAAVVKMLRNETTDDEKADVNDDLKKYICAKETIVNDGVVYQKMAPDEIVDILGDDEVVAKDVDSYVFGANGEFCKLKYHEITTPDDQHRRTDSEDIEFGANDVAKNDKLTVDDTLVLAIIMGAFKVSDLHVKRLQALN